MVRPLAGGEGMTRSRSCAGTQAEGPVERAIHIIGGKWNLLVLR
jgi:DNA-binding HxlR family transcriptional regulator